MAGCVLINATNFSDDSPYFFEFRDVKVNLSPDLNMNEINFENNACRTELGQALIHNPYCLT